MENIKVIACGVTADYRISVTLKDDQDIPYTLWYHTTFYKVEDALEYLKVLYKEGISQKYIEDGLWLTLQELRSI
jgi:hypothetical protein